MTLNNSETTPLISEVVDPPTKHVPGHVASKHGIGLPTLQVATLFAAYFGETVVGVYAYPFLAEVS